MVKQRTKGVYKVQTEKINGVWFRGQFLIALKELEKGGQITIADFKNGAWESTSKLQRFIDLLNQANITYKRYGSSLRSSVITK